MTTDQLAELIRTTLAAGCGVVIQWAFSEFVAFDTEAHGGTSTLSAFQKRWVVIGLCALVPSALYALLCAATGISWEWFADLAYCGTAFVATQGVHSVGLSRDTGDKPAIVRHD